MQLATLKKPIEQELLMVNELLKEHFFSTTALINDVVTNFTTHRGKQLRPTVLLSVANACDHQNVDNRINLAASFEYMHIATLLHDDVIDDSELRRGASTANAIFGNKVAILAGDFLYTKALQLLASIKRYDILMLSTETLNTLTQGEIKQLSLKNTAIDEKTYFNIIHDKTSILFSCAAECGAMLAHVPTNIQQQFKRYGTHLGNAFQLIDDVLDYSAEAETLGKNIGDDFAEGKYTLPIIAALQQASQQDQAFLKNCLSKQSCSDLDRAIDILQQTNALDYTRDLAYKEAAKARHSLQGIPHSQYLQTLLELCDFFVQRQH